VHPLRGSQISGKQAKDTSGGFASNLIRGLVSKKKNRFQDSTFDLDLTCTLLCSVVAVVIVIVRVLTPIVRPVYVVSVPTRCYTSCRGHGTHVDASSGRWLHRGELKRATCED
jgi:hypothetical protein